MRLPALQVGLVTAGLAVSIQMPHSASNQSNYNALASYAIGDLQIGARPTELDHKEAPAETAEKAEPVQATAPAPVVVTVQKGDNLSKIAAAHNVTVQRLFDANAFIANPSVISAGQQIRIPLADEVLASRPMPVAPKPVVARTASSRRITTSAPAIADGSVWDALARCESGGNWAINTGNGYYGGLQFSAATWRAVGGQGLPHQNSREEQILRGQILQARSGWGQWPACSLKLGLR